MNKIISINIGGFVFQIEEDAYDKLENYLNAIRKRFGDNEGSDEIVEDIEARIAEMLHEKIQKGAPSITTDHVDEVIKMMGNPGQIADEEDETESKQEYQSFSTSKRLYRDPDDQVLSGVCSGIGHYFGIDPVWIRGLFAISFFMFGTGILVYFILYAIIPEAKTSADKLRMHGEKINIDNLEKRIREEMGKVQNAFTGKKSKKKARDLRDKAVGFGGEVASSILSVIVRVVGICLAFGGLTALVFITIAWLHLFPQFTFPPMQHFELLYATEWEYLLANISLILLIYIPLVAIVTKGITMLLGMGKMPGIVKQTAGLTWLSALVTGVIMLIITLSNFAESDVIYEEQPIAVSDTIYVDANLIKPDEDYGYGYDYRFRRLLRIGDELFNKNVRFDIKRTTDSKASLEIRKYAQGGTNEMARGYAEQIDNKYTYKNDTLLIDASFTSTPPNLWRNQKVTYTLFIPDGVTVIIGRKMQDVLYDVDNIQNMYDRHMVGRAWLMTPKGLNCENCKEARTSELRDKDYIKELFYENYSEIQVDNTFKVFINQGDEYKVILGGKEKWVSRVTTEMRGDRLYFDMDKNWLSSQNESEVVEVHITMPIITRLEVNGASEVELHNIDQPRLSIQVNGASDLIALLSVKKLNVELNGACSLKLRGSGETLDLETNGVSQLIAEDYKAEHVTCDMSGAGSATVWAIKTLTGDLNGVADLQYKGSPEITIKKDNVSRLTPKP